MAKLELRGVGKAYAATVALRRGDLAIEAGEIHALVGSNGSGKSTLCKIVAGSVRPDHGEVLVDGRPVRLSDPRASHELGIGIFYQELSLAAHRTVAENIGLAALPARGLFLDRQRLAGLAGRYVALFDGVSGADFSAEAVVGSLRADQRQLVEIMKTLASEAEILLFDEPTSALDRSQVDRFFTILRDLAAAGRSIVFISHRMDEITAIADRVTVIRDGETIRTLKSGEVDPAEVIRLMAGEMAAAPAALRPSATRSAQPVVLSATGLAGSGFRDIDFEVKAGEIIGFGGLHGQGQSALLRALFGAGRISAGRLALGGADFEPRDPRAAIRAGVAYVSGDRRRDGILPGRSINENAMPVHYFLKRLTLAGTSRLRERVLPALAALKTRYAGLASAIDTLSGGNQQKVVIARWLIDKPRVLLLDDPTKGIDLATKTELFALIRALAENGMGILLYSSEDAELLGNADRILVFNSGRISAELAGAERTRFHLYRAAYEAA